MVWAVTTEEYKKNNSVHMDAGSARIGQRFSKKNATVTQYAANLIETNRALPC